MRVTFLGIVAGAFCGLVLSPTARATDTMMLAGTGSLSGLRSDAAPVITLKGDATTTADTIDVHGPVARGVGGVARFGGRAAVGGFRYAAHYPAYRGWYGYGRSWYGYGRPWGGWYGYGRPWGGWYGYGRPWYGYYRPYLGWYPGINLNFGFGGYPYYPVAYAPVTYSSPIIAGYPSPPPPPPQMGETAPPPRPNDGYRYDGGPANPVPAPRPVTPQTPPVPPPGTVDTIARRPVKKIDYPAYGESPSKARVVTNPLFVKGQ